MMNSDSKIEIMKEKIEEIEQELVQLNEDPKKIKMQAVNRILTELNKVVPEDENK